MNKKFISTVALILCIVFAGGCQGNTAATQKKEAATIAEIISDKDNDYTKDITLGKMLDISYDFSGVSSSAVLAEIAKESADSDFDPAETCAGGDKIKATYVVTMKIKETYVSLAEGTDSYIYLGGGTLAAEIEKYIIDNALANNQTHEFDVKENLDLDLSETKQRDLHVMITIFQIMRLKQSDGLAQKVEEKKKEMDTAAETELAWNAFINLCDVDNVREPVINSFMESKRKSDSVFASKFDGATVLELTGIESNDEYERSLKAYAKRKYKEELVTYYLINNKYKESCQDVKDLDAEYEKYAEIMGLESVDKLSQNDKDQVKLQMQKEIVKKIIFEEMVKQKNSQAG